MALKSIGDFIITLIGSLVLSSSVFAQDRSLVEVCEKTLVAESASDGPLQKVQILSYLKELTKLNVLTLNDIDFLIYELENERRTNPIEFRMESGVKLVAAERLDDLLQLSFDPIELAHEIRTEIGNREEKIAQESSSVRETINEARVLCETAESSEIVGVLSSYVNVHSPQAKDLILTILKRYVELAGPSVITDQSKMEVSRKFWMVLGEKLYRFARYGNVEDVVEVLDYYRSNFSRFVPPTLGSDPAVLQMALSKVILGGGFRLAPYFARLIAECESGCSHYSSVFYDERSWLEHYPDLFLRLIAKPFIGYNVTTDPLYITASGTYGATAPDVFEKVLEGAQYISLSRNNHEYISNAIRILRSEIRTVTPGWVTRFNPFIPSSVRTMWRGDIGYTRAVRTQWYVNNVLVRMDLNHPVEYEGTLFAPPRKLRFWESLKFNFWRFFEFHNYSSRKTL